MMTLLCPKDKNHTKVDLMLISQLLHLEMVDHKKVSKMLTQATDQKRKPLTDCPTKTQTWVQMNNTIWTNKVHKINNTCKFTFVIINFNFIIKVIQF